MWKMCGKMKFLLRNSRSQSTVELHIKGFCDDMELQVDLCRSSLLITSMSITVESTTSGPYMIVFSMIQVRQKLSES